MKKQYYIREPIKPSRIKIRKFFEREKEEVFSFSLRRILLNILRICFYLTITFLVAIGIMALYYPEIRMEIFSQIELLLRTSSMK